MYVIMVYDVKEKRVAKVLKIGRRYLTRVQNSVLEGEITKANFEMLKVELRDVIEEEEDSVLFYILRTEVYIEREVIGVEKGGEAIIL